MAENTNIKTNIRQFNPVFQDLWRQMVQMNDLYFYVIIKRAESRGSSNTEEINKAFVDLRYHIKELLNSKKEECVEFLLFLLDEPIPLIWETIVENLANLNPTTYPSILTKFYQIQNGTYFTAVGLPRNQGSTKKMMETISKYIRLNDTPLEEKILYFSGNDKTERKFLFNLPNTVEKETWFPLIWRRIERNLNFLLGEEKRWDPEYTQLDSNIIPHFCNMIALHLDKSTVDRVPVTIFAIWFNHPNVMRGFDEISYILKSKPFQDIDWAIGEFLPIFLSKLNLSRDSELREYFTEILHTNGELKHLMKMTGLMNLEKKAQVKFNPKTMKFDDVANNSPSRQRRIQTMVEDEHTRDLLISFMSELGNSLVKKDNSLADSIDGLFSSEKNLKNTIEERRCCLTNGRNGDRYCNICGRVIPDEMRVTN